jgi:diaminopimelate decarboxylase
MHSLSNNLSATAHLEMIDLYRRKVIAWERRFGMRCEVLNFGGGIGIDYATPAATFDWKRFAQGLHGLLDATFPAHWREIDFECGRFLVAACGSYATEVLDIKRNHGVSYVLVRGGTHHLRLPASWQHSHPFDVLGVDRWSLPAPRPQAVGEPVTVVGQLCTPKDVLARDAVVPCVRAGDVLVFTRAGAYGWEISHHDFLSHPHPEHVFLSSDGAARAPTAREAAPPIAVPARLDACDGQSAAIVRQRSTVSTTMTSARPPNVNGSLD